MKGLRRKFAKWADQTTLACAGIGYVLKLWRYALLAAVLVLVFAWVLTLVSSGSTDINLLLSALPLDDKLAVLGGVFVRVFTNLTTLDGVSTLLLSLLQGITIAMLVFNFKQQHKLDSESATNTGIASLIAMFGVGCSACGTSLLMPIISIIFSSSAYIVAEVASRTITIVAFVLILYAMRRLGLLAFTHVTAKKHRNGHEN
jgi:hypothetical protein